MGKAHIIPIAIGVKQSKSIKILRQNNNPIPATPPKIIEAIGPASKILAHILRFSSDLFDEGDEIRVEKLDAEVGSAVTFDQVVAVSDGSLKVGADVASATVTGTVVNQGKGKKVIVYKYKRKTGYHKKNGHRQAYTQVKIEKING